MIGSSLQAARIVGLDPGRKALFTAVVHNQQAADSLQGCRAEECSSLFEYCAYIYCRAV